MITIPTATIFPNYAGIFFLADAQGQENSTAILKDIHTMLSKQTSSQQKIATTPNKSATQGAYITLSVFFLVISLVLFGLRMTMKAGQNFGKYLDLMIIGADGTGGCVGGHVPNRDNHSLSNHTLRS